MFKVKQIAEDSAQKSAKCRQHFIPKMLNNLTRLPPCIKRTRVKRCSNELRKHAEKIEHDSQKNKEKVGKKHQKK